MFLVWRYIGDRHGRPATGRSEESLEAERLYGAAWYTHKKRVGLRRGSIQRGSF